jgi:hypothetical protein
LGISPKAISQHQSSLGSAQCTDYVRALAVKCACIPGPSPTIQPRPPPCPQVQHALHSIHEVLARARKDLLAALLVAVILLVAAACGRGRPRDVDDPVGARARVPGGTRV